MSEVTVVWAIAIAAGSALFGAVVGGGMVSRIVYRALKDQIIVDLKPIFARRSELDNVGGKVTGAVSLATMAKDRADANADEIIRLQMSEKHRWAPVLDTLTRINERLDASDIRGERHAALLDEITRRLDRGDGRRRG